MNLYGVSGSSGDNVYAVGAGKHGEDEVYGMVILHYDGSSWTWTEQWTDHTMSDVWVPSDTSALAAGVLWHYEMGPPPEVWHVGIILRRDDLEWSTVTDQATEIMHTIWCADETVAFAAGAFGAIERTRGESWSGMDSGTSVSLNAVHGTGEDHVFVVGDNGAILHYQGP